MEKSSHVVVLIHGGQVGAWVWDSVRSHLDFPSILVDLPAHGNRSGQLKGLRTAECVETVFREVPPNGRVVLVGHSMGGAIALALAKQLADRVAHLVLIAGVVPVAGASMVSSFPFRMRLISDVFR